MASVPHAISRAWHRRQMAAISQTSGLDRILRYEISRLLSARLDHHALMAIGPDGAAARVVEERVESASPRPAGYATVEGRRLVDVTRLVGISPVLPARGISRGHDQHSRHDSGHTKHRRMKSRAHEP